jgi:type I restriction enzyme R subunit
VAGKVNGPVGHRAKEGLMVDFINQTDLDHLCDKASVIDAIYS